MKYCDLVMKGGITSGIVYPNAALALARDYRFKNIGGTSAGAIAAAACAAAAYGDRRKMASQMLRSPAEKAGFEGLGLVAKELAREGFIYELFKPAWGAGSAYRLLVRLTGNSGAMRKATALAVAVVAIAPIETILLAAALFGVAFLAGGKHGMLAAALPAILCAYAGGIAASVLRVARVARGNLLGLCSGLRRRRRFGKKGEPALTEWLHGVLQDLSGKPPTEPLTFHDLWNAPRYEDEPETGKALALQMITTSVSHHEPRTLPFENGRFWFREDQFAKLFPPQIVAWLVERGAKVVKRHLLPAGAHAR